MHHFNAPEAIIIEVVIRICYVVWNVAALRTVNYGGGLCFVAAI